MEQQAAELRRKIDFAKRVFLQYHEQEQAALRAFDAAESEEEKAQAKKTWSGAHRMKRAAGRMHDKVVSKYQSLYL